MGRIALLVSLSIAMSTNQAHSQIIVCNFKYVLPLEIVFNFDKIKDGRLALLGARTRAGAARHVKCRNCDKISRTLEIEIGTEDKYHIYEIDRFTLFSRHWYANDRFKTDNETMMRGVCVAWKNRKI